ncbi:hypothetical protein H17ap60334_10110 [Thermosipho africanus H17ap60334]|uniref:hypothetical protein n=1 Tax=Thermosipho africanus TaxID=2421 RepID=UPI00028CF04A|nr:hypothetical protein [Thermosipho africanus]EKF48635.1 hypothetical protein H17ap60334_10110 [Thermosipho africanus H17ap60334]
MKKLLVVLMSLFVLTALFAAEATPVVSWSGSASFTLGIDEKGVDIDGGLVNPSVTISPSADTQFGVSFTIDVIGKSLTFSGLTFENDVFSLDYAKGPVAFQYFVGTDSDGNPLIAAEDNISVSLKAVDGLTVVFQDVVTEVDYTTGTPTTHKWFDDFVGLTYSVADVNLAVAFYDADTATETNLYQYGLNANTSLDLGFATLDLDGVAGVVDASNTVAYGISESLSAEFSFVTLTQSFAWKQNVSQFAFAGDSDASSVSVKAAVEYSMSPLTVSGDVSFKIASLATPSEFTVPVNFKVAYADMFDASLALSWADVVNAATSINMTLAAGYDDDMVAVNASAEWADLVGAATAVDLNADLSVTPIDALTLGAAVRYASEEFGYNLNAKYMFDDNTTFTVFYGTLYGDDDEDGKTDIHKDDAQWYAKLCWSTSF